MTKIINQQFTKMFIINDGKSQVIPDYLHSLRW